MSYRIHYDIAASFALLMVLSLSGCAGQEIPLNPSGEMPDGIQVEHFAIKNTAGGSIDCIIVKRAGDFGDAVTCDWQQNTRP